MLNKNIVVKLDDKVGGAIDFALFLRRHRRLKFDEKFRRRRIVWTRWGGALISGEILESNGRNLGKNLVV